ncbi:MAG: InlB B-repeat-containing protein, partial [Clostridia bacterium]|nr:InlB B-repeat-containing protein [Clostridia bacterium]
KWIKNENTVSFDGNGATGGFTAPIQISVGASEALTANGFTRDYYSFAGWATQANGEVVYTDQQEYTMIENGGCTLYAVWVPVEYDITYVLGEGTNDTENPTKYTVESEITFEAPTAPEHYEFVDWRINGVKAEGIALGSHGEITVTAVWKAVEYDITYDLAGGSVATANPTIYTVATDDITLVNPTREGYTFTGWTGTDLSGATQTVTIAKGSTGDRSYVATWAAEEYAITFDFAGGDVNATYPSEYTIETDTFTVENPSRTGYTFAGWTGTGLTSAVQTLTIQKGSTGPRTYTATWTVNEYAIAYDLAGGTVSTANPTKYTIETDTFTLTNPTKAGYVFAGWTGTGLSGATQTVTIAKGSTGARTYTATWITEGFTIAYDLAGGEVSGNPAVYQVTTETITLVNPTREGYTFAGWTGTGLTDKTMNVTIPKGSTGDRSYTANWDLVEYTISYDLAGGSVATANPVTYTITTDSITLVNPTREGYTFAGWTGTDLSGATQTVTIAKGSTG